MIKFLCDGCGKEIFQGITEDDKRHTLISDIESETLCSDCFTLGIRARCKKISEFQREHRFLSNFWLCSIVYKGTTYKSSEHAYQAAKCLSQIEAELIRNSQTPGEAKKKGRVVRIRSDWDKVKLEVMEEILEYKFAVPSLKTKLLATGNSFLQEGNYWNDEFWGVNLKNGRGENHLGKILMRIRMKLQEEN